MREACEEPSLSGLVAAKAATFRSAEVARTKNKLVNIAGNNLLEYDVGRAIPERRLLLSFVVGIRCSVCIPSHDVCLELANVHGHSGQMASDDIGFAFGCNVVDVINANTDPIET